MRNKVLIAIMSCLTMIAFQNCGKAPLASAAGTQGTNDTQKVIGTAAAYTQVTYNNQYQYGTPAGSDHIDLDLTTGALNVLTSSGMHSCTIDAARLSEMREIIAGAQICEPAPLPPGSVSCLAFGPSDITLSNATASVQLSPIICNTGTVLCGDADGDMRALIKDIATNPPASCN